MSQNNADLENRMKARLDKFRAELAAVRTGRANPQTLDGVKVECYGSLVPLKQVAAVSVPEARTLEVRPWDPANLEALEKALRKSDLGVSPQSDGHVLRLTMPAMTEERRRQIVKDLGRSAEEARVGLRAERREAIERLRKVEKLAEDERKRQEEAIQRLTDAYIKRVEEALALKEKEVITL